MEADQKILESGNIIEFELKVQNRSQAIAEAARILQKELKNRSEINFSTKYFIRLNKFRLDKNRLALSYEILPHKNYPFFEEENPAAGDR